jgi:hypothetical protein
VLDAGDKVVRVGVGEVYPRPDLAEVLQADKAGQVGHLRYDVLPNADVHGITADEVRFLQVQLAQRGYHWSDAAPDNAGRVAGRLVVTDPGGLAKVGPNINQPKE